MILPQGRSVVGMDTTFVTFKKLGFLKFLIATRLRSLNSISECGACHVMSVSISKIQISKSTRQAGKVHPAARMSAQHMFVGSFCSSRPPIFPDSLLSTVDILRNGQCRDRAYIHLSSKSFRSPSAASPGSIVSPCRFEHECRVRTHLLL